MSAARRHSRRTYLELVERFGTAKEMSSIKPPGARQVETLIYTRDSKVVAAVKKRADGKCERPGCGHELFNDREGSPFLEVHHIQPLAERGADHPLNAVALCPSCHREAHFGAESKELRSSLKRAAAAAHEAAMFSDETA